jgi:hypothetical protein
MANQQNLILELPATKHAIEVDINLFHPEDISFDIFSSSADIDIKLFNNHDYLVNYANHYGPHDYLKLSLLPGRYRLLLHANQVEKKTRKIEVRVKMKNHRYLALDNSSFRYL